MLSFKAGRMGMFSLFAGATAGLGTDAARAEHRYSSCGGYARNVGYAVVEEPGRVVYAQPARVYSRVYYDRPYRSSYYYRRPIHGYRRSVHIGFGHRSYYRSGRALGIGSYRVRGHGLSIRLGRGHHRGYRGGGRADFRSIRHRRR